MSDRAEMKFGVVAPPAGIQEGCKRCGKVLQTGAAMIEVQVKDDQSVYTLASTKKFTCCGEEKKFSELFDSAEEAESKIQILERGMAEHGSVQIELNKVGTLQADQSVKPLERPAE